MAMRIVNENGPSGAYSIAVIVSNKLYVHGGVKKHNDLQPQTQLHCYDFATDKWRNLTTVKCPGLSHHAAFVTDDRFINIVGGWDGKSRASNVHVYDIRNEVWLDNCLTDNFPTGAGLSSHSVTPLASGSALIIGRLGGLKTQRKTSSMLLCERMDQTRFHYTELPTTVASRSGHSCTTNTACTSLIVIGGREEKNGSYVETVAVNQPLLQEDFATASGSLQLIPSSNWQSRKYHSAIRLEGEKVLVFGGESSIGASSSEPMNECLVWSPKVSKWYKCQNLSMPKLTGHKTFALSHQHFVYGGFTDKWRINKTLFELLVNI